MTVLLVGLTGGIGSGKSTVSSLLAEKGAVIIDADRIVHEQQMPGSPVLAAMVEEFGDGILRPDGSLDRPRMAEIAFSSDDARRRLGEIVHPAVGAEIARRLAEEAGTDHVVVLDVPLMVESGRGGHTALIVVDCEPEVAVRRLVEQRGMGEPDVRARMAAQASREERLARADYVIDNSGDLGSLRRQVDDVWARVQGLAQGEAGERDQRQVAGGDQPDE